MASPGRTERWGVCVTNGTLEALSAGAVPLESSSVYQPPLTMARAAHDDRNRLRSRGSKRASGRAKSGRIVGVARAKRVGPECRGEGANGRTTDETSRNAASDTPESSSDAQDTCGWRARKGCVICVCATPREGKEGAREAWVVEGAGANAARG